VAAAVEQSSGPAHYFDIAVARHPGEGGVDRNEREVPIEHGHRLGHRTEHLARDPALALRAAILGDVTRGAGHPQATTIGIAFNHAAACTYPPPGLALGVAGAVIGGEQRDLAAQVAEHRFAHLREVILVDRLVADDLVV